MMIWAETVLFLCRYLIVSAKIYDRFGKGKQFHGIPSTEHYHTISQTYSTSV